MTITKAGKMKSKFSIVDTIERTCAGLIRCLIYIILLNNVAEAAPSSLAKKLVDGGGPYDDYTQEYLTQFGYLPRGNREMSNLRKDDSIQLALMRLQDFAGLRPTGLVDHETRKLLLRKRCGLPDVPFDGSGGHLTPRYRRHDDDQAADDGVKVRQRRRLRRVKRYVLHGSKWDHLNVTYKVNNSARTLSEGRTRRVIYDAFQVWSKASKLTFQETRDNNADIVLKFAAGYHGDNYPFDGPNVVLAHAFFPARGMGGDVHFDDDEPWNDRMAKDNTAHEIGHSLGLGHSKVQNSLMYPYYKYDMKEVKLEYDDIMGIQALYGPGAGGIPRKPVETTTIRTFEEDDDWTTTSPMRTAPHSTTTAPKPAPEPCDGRLDAVARIRNEIFVFKGQYYWRFNENGELTSRPSEIHRFFYGLPKNLTNVDAVYEWADRDRITIFIGRQFYEFHGTRLVQEPKSLTNIGLPDKIPHVDAAFVWEYNERTYLFAGKKYWRFDKDNRLVEPEYPRSIETVWEGLQAYIDAAFTDKTGTTFFFKDDFVYKFNNFFMRVEKNYPKPINEFWPYCAKVKSQNLVAVAANYRQYQETELHSHTNSHSERVSLTVANYCTLITVILLFHVICSLTLCDELTYQKS